MRKIMLVCLLFSLSSLSLAQNQNFTVNPETIRQELFAKNISLRQALYNVQRSKLNVNMARSKLLPSVNLTILLPALANPTFLLGSISYLFPFLIPSNWSSLKEQKEVFESDKAGYRALQLNVLSNMLSLYYTYLNDRKVREIYAEQVNVLATIYKNLKIQSDVLANIPLEDLQQAYAEWEDAKIKVSKLNEILNEEEVNIRGALNLPLGTILNVEDVALISSEFENKTMFEIADHALKVAPESMQMDLLIKAGNSAKFSKMFGFISSASISGSANGDSTAFDNLKVGGAFTFGFDQVVNVKIAQNNISAIKLRQEQLRVESEKTAEILSKKFNEIKQQQSMAYNSLQSRLLVFETQKKNYDLGFIPLQTLLQTQAKLTDVKLIGLKTDLDLNMQRLALQRLVIDGDFLKVKGCQVSSVEKERKWFEIKKEESLDTLCNQAN